MTSAIRESKPENDRERGRAVPAFGKKLGLGMALPPPAESGLTNSPWGPGGCIGPVMFIGRGDAVAERPIPAAGPGPIPRAGDVVAARASPPPGPKAGEPVLTIPPAPILGEAVADLDNPGPCAMLAATSYGEGSIGVPILCGPLGDPARLPGTWLCMSNPTGLFAGMFICGSSVNEIGTGPMDIPRSRSNRAYIVDDPPGRLPCRCAASSVWIMWMAEPGGGPLYCWGGGNCAG